MAGAPRSGWNATVHGPSTAETRVSAGCVTVRDGGLPGRNTTNTASRHSAAASRWCGRPQCGTRPARATRIGVPELGGLALDAERCLHRLRAIVAMVHPVDLAVGSLRCTNSRLVSACGLVYSKSGGAFSAASVWASAGPPYTLPLPWRARRFRTPKLVGDRVELRLAHRSGSGCRWAWGPRPPRRPLHQVADLAQHRRATCAGCWDRAPARDSSCRLASSISPSDTVRRFISASALT